MFDTVNFWIDGVGMSGFKTFDIVPCLSEITEKRNGDGYSCSGKTGDYSVFVYEGGISLKGSLAKNYFGDNLQTLTRRSVKQAIEDLSDRLQCPCHCSS